MTRTDWKRLMNPIEWGKPIYGLFVEIFGSKGASFSLYALSLVIAGLLVYSYWSSVADSYRKDHPIAPTDYSKLHLDALKQLSAERKTEIKQPVLAAYQSEITIACPENVSLRFFPRSKAIVAVFTKNGVTSTAGPFRLETRDYRTYSLADKNWRAPKTFMATIASVPVLEPGHPSNEFVLILAHKNQLEVGSRSQNEYLVWPPADPSPVERYRLGLKIFGLDTEKTIQLCIRWERGTDKIELMEYSDSLPPSAF